MGAAQTPQCSTNAWGLTRPLSLHTAEWYNLPLSPSPLYFCHHSLLSNTLLAWGPLCSCTAEKKRPPPTLCLWPDTSSRIIQNESAPKPCKARDLAGYTLTAEHRGQDDKYTAFLFIRNNQTGGKRVFSGRGGSIADF